MGSHPAVLRRWPNIEPPLFKRLVLTFTTIRPLGYESVHLPLCKVTDAPFHNQGDVILNNDLFFINQGATGREARRRETGI